jgi:hypothetical protein
MVDVKKARSEGLLAICFQSKLDNAVLLLALVIGVYARGYFVEQPMRFDEASTYNMFINYDWAQVFSYLAPNNHVLHTILVKLATLGFGDDPLAIRIPAFIFGVLSIILIFCVCRLLGGTGSFAALITAVHPYLILFSTNARGYSLLIFFVLALVILGYAVALRPSLIKTTGFAFVAALGLLVMPTMLFPLSGIYCWVAYATYKGGIPFRGVFTRYWLLCGIEIIFLTALFYAPVVMQTGLSSIVNNEYVSAEGFEKFIHGLRWHLESTIRQFLRDIPIVISAVLLALTALGLYKACITQGTRIASLLFICLSSAAALLLLNHRIPFDRTWIYFIPLVSIATDYGMRSLLVGFSQKVRSAAYAVAVVTALGLTITLTRTGAILQNDETGIFPAGPVVGQYLAKHMKPEDGLFIDCCENYSLFYYLTLYGAPTYRYSPEPAKQNNYYVVPKGKQLKSLTDRPLESIFEASGTQVYFEHALPKETK